MWMQEAVVRERWQHTSAVMALLANCHRDPKRRSSPYRPSDFDPTATRRRKQDAIVVPLAALKNKFAPTRKKGKR